MLDEEDEAEQESDNAGLKPCPLAQATPGLEAEARRLSLLAAGRSSQLVQCASHG
jgi:hypothetical protein